MTNSLRPVGTVFDVTYRDGTVMSCLVTGHELCLGKGKEIMREAVRVTQIIAGQDLACLCSNVDAGDILFKAHS